MQFYRRKRIYFVLAAIAILLVTIYLHVTERLLQVNAGVCPESGRVLSENKLKRAMLQSLVNTYVLASDEHQRKTGNGWQVGIGEEIDLVGLKNLAREFFSNERAFEENFSIDIIAPAAHKGWRENVPDDSFSLFIYSNNKSELARIILSNSAERIDVTEKLSKVFSVGLIDKYLGYGNNFYSLSRIFISKDCCDNKTYYRTEREYRKDKSSAYLWTLKSIDKQIASGKDIISVSNCGDVMTKESEQGMGPRLNIPKWIRWGHISHSY